MYRLYTYQSQRKGNAARALCGLVSYWCTEVQVQPAREKKPAKHTPRKNHFNHPKRNLLGRKKDMRLLKSTFAVTSDVSPTFLIANLWCILMSKVSFNISAFYCFVIYMQSYLEIRKRRSQVTRKELQRFPCRNVFLNEVFERNSKLFSPLYAGSALWGGPEQFYREWTKSISLPCASVCVCVWMCACVCIAYPIGFIRWSLQYKNFKSPIT